MLTMRPVGPRRFLSVPRRRLSQEKWCLPALQQVGGPYGSLDFNRDAASEITTYDNDG